MPGETLLPLDIASSTALDADVPSTGRLSLKSSTTPKTPRRPTSASFPPVAADLHRALHRALPPLPAPSSRDAYAVVEAKPLPPLPSPEQQSRPMATAVDYMPGLDAESMPALMPAIDGDDFDVELTLQDPPSDAPHEYEGTRLLCRTYGDPFEQPLPPIPLSPLPGLLMDDLTFLPATPPPRLMNGFFPMAPIHTVDPEDEDLSDSEEVTRMLLDEHVLFQRCLSRWQRRLALASPISSGSDNDADDEDTTDDLIVL